MTSIEVIKYSPSDFISTLKILSLSHLDILHFYVFILILFTFKVIHAVNIDIVILKP